MSFFRMGTCGGLGKQDNCRNICIHISLKIHADEATKYSNVDHVLTMQTGKEGTNNYGCGTELIICFNYSGLKRHDQPTI